MKRVRNLSKLPARKVTIDDILYRADIDGVLVDTNKDKENFTEILVIATNFDNTIYWRHSGMIASRLLYLMEVVKHSELSKE